MIATALALLLAAPPPAAPSAGAFLRARAASAPSCRTTAVDGELVRADLFSPASALCPVATVGEEAVPLRELASALELQHLSRSPRAASPAKRPEMDFAPALERLITIRLIIQEAREMQLDQAPEFRAQIEAFRAAQLRGILQREAVRGVRPDPAEVERLYRDAVREWKLASILVDREDDAKAFEKALASGERFDGLATRFVAEKRGRGWGKSEFAPRKKMLPEVLEAVQRARPGVPSGPVQVPGGRVWFRVDGTRIPKGVKDARADARARSLARLEREAIRRYYLRLVTRWATTDEKVLRELDFEAGGEAGFESLLQDQRPLARIAGEPAVTVADLGRELALRFFHGIAGPIREKRVNPQKQEAFEKLLGERLFAKEAASRKLETRPEILRAVEDRERALAFDTFVQKVIAPDVKVTEAEGLRDYEARKAEFTPPDMVRLDGIAFGRSEDAQAALDKLRAGTDFGWLRTNAAAQVPVERRTLAMEGRTLSVKALPRELSRAIEGAREGELRLYGPSPTEIWVVRVAERSSGGAQPYPDVRDGILKRIYAEKVTQAIRDYADELRKAQRVDVLITRVAP